MDKLAELEKELLADMEENPVEYKETVSNVFEIDSNLRTINIPVSVKNIGVESDGDVKRLEFTMPKKYGEFDLSQFRIRINYMNANGDKSIYLVKDKKVSGDNITFSWLVGRNVTKYKGQVNFIVCLKLSNEKGEILKELNTTLCRLEVLEGLEVVPVIDEKTTDIIEQLLRMVETETTGAVQKVTEEGNKQVKEVQKAAQEIADDREQIQKNAESVTVLKEDLIAFKQGVELIFLHTNIKYGIRLSQNSGSSFSEAVNPKFACIQFLKVDVDRLIKLRVKNGFKIYVWCTDVDTLNNENGNVRILTNWVTGTNEVKCPYQYLMVSITSVNDIDIPIGNLVDIFYEDKPKYMKEEDNVEILGNISNIKWIDGEFVHVNKNGIFTPSPDWKRTEPIKVYENTRIKFNAYFGGNAGGAFFDRYGNCIKMINNLNETHNLIEFSEIVPYGADTFIYSHLKSVKNESQSIEHLDLVHGVFSAINKKNNYSTVKEMIESKAHGECRVGGYLFRSNVKEPKVLKHKQEAQPKEYFDVNSSIKQYEVMNKDYPHIEKFAFNDLPCEEIDFSPSDKGFIRIIVGKSSDDTFFVSHEASNYNNTFGNPDYDRLEITKDFKTFKTIWKSCNLSTISDGAIHLDGITNIKVRSVKEFSNGDFLIGACCKYPHNDSLTSYFILSSDMQKLTECECKNQMGAICYMRDENGGNIYDWHVDVKGNKAICTTYGNRKPETCLGVVWYTEDCGKNWQEVFRMVNHYQDGVNPEDTPVTETHIHGVMLDTFANKMFVIAGENNQNIFWCDMGKYSRDEYFKVIPIRRQLMFPFTPYTQVVNGYAFKDSLIFGSDQFGIGGIFRLNKLDSGEYSDIEIAHEFLPNIDLNITSYCTAEMFRRDSNTPLLMCQTREMNGRTETENEKLNKEHFGRVVATYDGINFVEVWKDTTYGEHDVNIDATLTKRNFSYCTRGMNCYLLQNGDAAIKYSGRDVYYFGGVPASSAHGNANGTSKILIIKNAIKTLM